MNNKIRVTALGCLHGHYPELEPGDLLLLTGDYTAYHTAKEFESFMKWVIEQPYEKKILIAGNHDTFLSIYPPEVLIAYGLVEKMGMFEDGDMEYLCDSGTEYKGLKIWGSPHSLWFDRINPICAAFTGSEQDLDDKFSLIPEDTDILITHTPMRHMLDQNKDGYHCGSSSLRKHIDRVKPSLHIFSHIHEQGSNQLLYKHIGDNTWCANVSIMNERYEPVNKPYYLEI